MATSLKVSITYCADCGYEPQTLDLANALMKTYGHDISSITLIPWLDGAFEVRVGDELVHSMMRDGGFPKNETVLEAVKAQLAG